MCPEHREPEILAVTMCFKIFKEGTKGRREAGGKKEEEKRRRGGERESRRAGEREREKKKNRKGQKRKKTYLKSLNCVSVCVSPLTARHINISLHLQFVRWVRKGFSNEVTCKQILSKGNRNLQKRRGEGDSGSEMRVIEDVESAKTMIQQLETLRIYLVCK